MGTNLVRKLNQISAKDIALAGGKGAQLGELLRIGMPVPAGFVVTTEAYKKFLGENGLEEKIRGKLAGLNVEDPDNVEYLSDQIGELIQNGELAEDLQQEILDSYDRLENKKVAVRSSATAEDAKETSFAGQLSTYLNTNKDDLLDTVKRCWASLFSPRALHYQIHHSVGEDIAVAVIVQEMVDADVSGIVFTAHPVTKSPDVFLIEAGWGLGEAIVSGMVTPDSYIVNKTTLSLQEENIGKQKKKVVSSKQGTETVSVPEENQNKQKLSEQQIQKLAKLCIKIENHYQQPQDIEWALSGVKFYILQSRPVTTL